MTITLTGHHLDEEALSGGPPLRFCGADGSHDPASEHLNDDELYRLATEPDDCPTSIVFHAMDCPECRKRVMEIRVKMAYLELTRDDAPNRSRWWRRTRAAGVALVATAAAAFLVAVNAGGPPHGFEVAGVQAAGPETAAERTDETASAVPGVLEFEQFLPSRHAVPAHEFIRELAFELQSALRAIFPYAFEPDFQLWAPVEVVQAGDTFEKIAQRRYDDNRLGGMLADHNTGFSVRGLMTGTEVQTPPLDDLLTSANQKKYCTLIEEYRER